MGFFLATIRYLSYVLLFCFCTICLACGLYYLAELIEEHEKLTKKILKYLSWVVFVAHLFVWIEGFPTFYVLIGIISHVLYYVLLPQFPKLKLNNLGFILASVFFVLDHYVWFSHFSSKPANFWDILAFFLVCVWLIPFVYFISLTSEDSSLPYGSLSASGEAIGDDQKNKSGNRIVLFFQQLSQIKDKAFTTRSSQYKNF